MSKIAKEDLDKLQLISKLLLDKETRAMKTIRHDCDELDLQQRRTLEEIARIQSDQNVSFADKKTSYQYLDVLKGRLARLTQRRRELAEQELEQKDRLKSALSTEIRLNTKD